ncbi:hypothetical protein DY000_02054782 [Brassica cretica]|uniref:NB-ARC domain-containing protein n=1 Tax=Brassica cretica TaxID=69181 RepID=A0ABQ7AIG8_BRACR|nr:hypothetical protein DY000_02054782 [Brassica cretica]
MLKEVEDVHSKGVFEVVAGPPAIAVAVERPLPNTIVGQENILERAWEHLMDAGTGMMGLYGMGGVGKTTLLEQINNKFLKRPVDGVEIVIFVVVSSELRVEMIQDAIDEKLGFDKEDWQPKEKSQKKFTTRSREVCGQMEVDDPMELPENVVVYHWRLISWAKIYMASKRTVEEWEQAIDTLASSAADFPGEDQLVIHNEEQDWIDKVEWEDEATKEQIHRIRGDIAKKLGLDGGEWDQKNENRRALEIHNVLRRRNMGESEFESGWSPTSKQTKRMQSSFYHSFSRRAWALVKCLQVVVLRGLEEEESPRVLALPGMDSLRKVIIRKCGMWEIKAERKTLSLTQGFPKPL